METGNYCAHAIDHIKSMSDRYLRREEPQLMVKLLEQAVKFYLPNSGILLGKDVCRSDLKDLFHLPFPICALEYWMGEDRGINVNPLMTNRAHRRIALCLDPAAISPSLYREFTDTLGLEAKHLPAHAIVVMSLFHGSNDNGDERGSGWQFVPAVAVIDVDSKDMEFPVLLFESASKQLTKILSVDQDEIRRKLALDVEDELSTAWQFLAAANCSNVKIEKLPAASKVSKKRMSKGLTPLFDYHILKIELPGAKREKPDAQAGTHAAPRTHLRRGHVRRLTNAEGSWTVWINAVVVNPQGIGLVTKEYHVIK